MLTSLFPTTPIASIRTRRLVNSAEAELTSSSLKFLNIFVVLGGLSSTFSLAYTPLIVLLACSAEKKPHLWV